MSKKRKRKRGKITKQIFSTTESNQMMNNIQILKKKKIILKTQEKFNLTSCVGINRVGFSLCHPHALILIWNLQADQKLKQMVELRAVKRVSTVFFSLLILFIKGNQNRDIIFNLIITFILTFWMKSILKFLSRTWRS